LRLELPPSGIDRLPEVTMARFAHSTESGQRV